MNIYLLENYKCNKILIFTGIFILQIYKSANSIIKNDNKYQGYFGTFAQKSFIVFTEIYIKFFPFLRIQLPGLIY